MEKSHYISLIYKQLKGDISLEEQSRLDIWRSQSSENEVLLRELSENWEATENYEPSMFGEMDTASDFARLQERIALDNQLVHSPQDKVKVAHQPVGKLVKMNNRSTTQRWIGWASAAVILLAAGFWFLGSPNASDDDSLLVKTRHGEQREVLLADGTKIWVNGNSELRYPAAFTSESRTVELVGEAYFDVESNSQKSFVVQTKTANITVLGTEFNVKTDLATTQTEVIVAEGKVRLASNSNNKKVDLTDRKSVV